MASFTPGQNIGRGDLDIFFVDPQGNPTNAAEIYYALFYVDPGPPEVEVLVGPAQRTPVNPQVGEYYAALQVPGNATLGNYRIRWYFREHISEPLTEVVQQFDVVEPETLRVVNYTDAQWSMINKLRLLLRDQCVGGEETVELDVDGEMMDVSLEDLWGTLHDLPLLTETQREKVRDAFIKGTLRTRSVSPSGQVEWKSVLHVSRAEIPWETIYKGTTVKGPFILTAGHRVFISPTEKMGMKDICGSGTGTALLSVSLPFRGERQLNFPQDCSWSDPNVGYRLLRSCGEIEKRQYMYDLTVEDWHNFVLLRSGVVISNSPDKFYHFRPPEHEGSIGRYNRVFGQIWEDAELLEYLERSLDWFNMFPPLTQGINSIDRLIQTMPAWRTAILWGAITHACFALSMNWIADEFSLRGDQRVTVVLPSGDEKILTLKELHEICKGDSCC